MNVELFDHTNSGATHYSTRLNGTTNEQTGLAKSISVMPGDVIKAEVYAKYLDATSSNWTTALTNFMTAIINGTAPAGTVIDGEAIGSTGGVPSPFGSLLNKNNETGDAPKAYLNYLVFDRNYKVLDGGFVRVTEAAKEDGSDGAHEELSKEIEIKEAGYVYLYLSNDNVALGGSAVEVYFDDFRVEHIKSPVVQVEDYYPFGLTYNSYRRENSLENRIKFQGQEHIDDLDLGWDSFKWRNHQPDIGRFFNIDPLADKYVHNSPYAFSENKVVVHRELEGLESVYVFDQANRPQDNGTPGTSYTAKVYVVNDENGTVNGPYSGSSYPNSISNTNNDTNHNTVNTGTHQYNNLSGHSGSSKKGLNLVDSNGDRKSPGTKPNDEATTMTTVNVHSGASDNGNYNSRGSEGCLTIKPTESEGFFGNFDWSGTVTVTKPNGTQVTYTGTTGTSSGTVTIHRGDTEESKMDKLKVELLQTNINQLNNEGIYQSNQN